jgi:Protein of unknown function (DUF3301)
MRRLPFPIPVPIESQAMDIASLLFLLLFAALAWYFFNSMRAHEAARRIGKKLCNELDLQFLDDTVASVKVRLARDNSGRRVFRRTYRFEFSETGNTRLEGHLILLDDKLESIFMEPYQILE